MPKYVIERDIPQLGEATAEQFKGIGTTSNSAIKKIGQKIQWLQTYVTGNKAYCVYIAPDEDTLIEHARLGGFPANAINEIVGMMDPTTAD